MFSVLTSTHASADTFNPNRIIDDGVFDNANSMSAAQIDAFLNSFASSCISPNSGFRAIDPTGYNPTNGFQYGGFVTAGQVIYDSAQVYGINPQVLITTLEKEQSLVTGQNNFAGYCNNGSQHKYAAAVGYGCPDSGTTYSYSGVNLYQRNGVTVTDTGTTCVNSASKAGFSQQVIRAAWLLKFGEQRSEGNVGWAVIKGNWNNSDDPQSCYGGPMTQGTWQRCPSGGSAYYDGYTTIDATAVHMDTGATAALYWYTPHFHGNQNFFSLFTGWFGSTQFPQPIGASLDVQPSTGIIYLVTGTTRYQVPDWDMMINYGLNSYPVQTVTDATIQGLTDGGLLTNLIYDNNGVYLVNNGTRYPVSSSMCTVWGFNCADGTFVKPLGAAFQTQYLQQGSLLTQLLKASGVVYKMSNGTKQPVANPQTLSDLGLSTTAMLPASTVNARHALGALLITTPGTLQFSPDPHIYYFDGSAYWTVPDMNTYYDWALDKAGHLAVPVSSYNQTPPTTSLLNSFATASSKYYLVDQGKKNLIPDNLASLWSPTLFAAGPSTLFNALASDSLSQLVLASPNVYVLDTNGKHYVQTPFEYARLQSIYGRVTSIRAAKVLSVAQGNDALVDGDVILKSDNHAIYVVNSHKLTYISSPDTFNAYGYNWGAVRSYDNSITSDYPLDNLALGNGLSSDGIHFVVSGGTLYQLTSSQATDFGAIDSKFTPITKTALARSTTATLPRFMLNTDDGRVYYASGGAIHYVSSYTAYMAYGGGYIGRVPVNTSTIQSFVLAQPI
jgi:hypothetical protein